MSEITLSEFPHELYKSLLKIKPFKKHLKAEKLFLEEALMISSSGVTESPATLL